MIFDLWLQEAELRAKCGGSGLDFLCNPLAGNFTILTPEMFTGNPSQGVSNRIAPGLIVDVKQNSSVVVIPSNANIHFSQVSRQAVIYVCSQAIAGVQKAQHSCKLS